MDYNTKLDQQQIDRCHALIGKIDYDSQKIFSAAVNTENQIDAQVFENGAGVYFSCRSEGRILILISFEQDSDKYNDELTKLVQSTASKAGGTNIMVYMYKRNKKIVEHIIDTFKIPPKFGGFHYKSLEFIMRRENFNKAYIHKNLDFRPYEPAQIDTYLEMLDESMDFGGGTPNYRESKEYLAQDFAAYAKDDRFEALWIDNALAGVYWRNGADAEIDTLAVSPKFQGKGYGSDLLTRAIEKGFATTDADFAFLYSVDWNTQGQAFYERYGMEILGQPCIVQLPKAE